MATNKKIGDSLFTKYDDVRSHTLTSGQQVFEAYLNAYNKTKKYNEKSSEEIADANQRFDKFTTIVEEDFNEPEAIRLQKAIDELATENAISQDVESHQFGLWVQQEGVIDRETAEMLCSYGQNLNLENDGLIDVLNERIKSAADFLPVGWSQYTKERRVEFCGIKNDISSYEDTKDFSFIREMKGILRSIKISDVEMSSSGSHIRSLFSKNGSLLAIGIDTKNYHETDLEEALDDISNFKKEYQPKWSSFYETDLAKAIKRAGGDTFPDLLSQAKKPVETLAESLGDSSSWGSLREEIEEVDKSFAAARAYLDE